MKEGLRWRITKAVRASNLPAPARLIMLVLADVAEVGTAEIPERFTPSISVLAAETGLGRSTVKLHLAALEAARWIGRSQPDKQAQYRGERTRYRLCLPVGQDVADPGPADGPPIASSGPTVGQDLAEGRPAVGHQETDPSDLDQTNRSTDLVVPDRLDVEQVCRHLADRIEANGSKRPTVTKTWRDAARRLLDKDGRSVEQVMRAIDWCQDHDFWKANVMSMPKLREQYDRLRLEAQRGRGSPKPSTTDQRVAAAMALAQKFAEREAS